MDRQLLESLKTALEAPPQMVYGGQSLTSVLQSLVLTINDQADKLAQLQAYTYATHTEQWQRIGALETAAVQLQSDVGLPSRPTPGGHATLHAAVLANRSRLALVESKLLVDRAFRLERASTQLLTRRYFSGFMHFSQRKRALSAIRQASSWKLLRKCFSKLRRFVRVHSKSRVQERSLRRLEHSANVVVLRACFATWSRWRLLMLEERDVQRHAQQDAAETMSTISLRGVARRHYLKWFALVQARSIRREQLETVLSMEQTRARTLATRFYKRWHATQQAAAQRHRKVGLADALLINSFEAHAGRRFHRWAQWARRLGKRNRALSVVRIVGKHAQDRLASAYLGKLTRLCFLRARQRNDLEHDRVHAELSQRYETVATQLEVTIRTIRNTNAVLSDLVERVLALDERINNDNDGARGMAFAPETDEDGAIELPHATELAPTVVTHPAPPAEALRLVIPTRPAV